MEEMRTEFASAMIQMPVSMCDQKWKLFVLLVRQQFQDRLRQGHRVRVGNRAGID
jgi:hypothetical protein